MIDRAWGDRLSAADERWLTRGYFTCRVRRAPERHRGNLRPVV